ncbi:MAG: hypothetical protein M1816_004294 [Peltula sp. TS41687]|nr:MAG: hypothetical protein M1816_004294 [Peltula sp. TS41687]
MIHAAALVYQQCEERTGHDGARRKLHRDWLWDGCCTFSHARWDFWKKRLCEAQTGEALASTKKLAATALKAMLAVESEAVDATP